MFHKFLNIFKISINKLFILAFLFFILLKTSNAQNVEYAKKIITELSSSKYYGRGYTNKGDYKAAKFISNELKKHKINSFGNNYFQKLKFPINTIEGNLLVKLDNTTLSPSIDYMVKPNSKSCKGKYQIALLDSSIINNDTLLFDFLKSNLTNKFLWIDTTGTNNDKQKLIKALTSTNILKLEGFIEPSYKKLTFSVSTIKSNYCQIIIDKNKITHLPDSIELIVNSKFKKNYTSQNIVGYLQGKSDSIIIIGAHYDHLGIMGNETFFPGANDNCSGIATTLDFARYFSENKPKYTIVFILYTAEEAGLLGSKFFVENPLFNLKKVKFVFNLDMVGTGEEGICIVNGSVMKKEFELFEKINKEQNLLANIKQRGEATNSDHYFFYKNGIKSIFIYTLGGSAEYHNPKDIADILPLNNYNSLFLLIKEFISNYE